MASQINNVCIEGMILGTPIIRPDGHVEFTLQNHEEWTRPDGSGKESRENMLGIIALPNSQPARRLSALHAGSLVTVLGSLRTTHHQGPKGGTQTKTKITARRILTPS